VLTGLIAKISDEVRAFHVEDMESLDKDRTGGVGACLAERSP
jgi:hypothetical protein